MSSNAPQQLSDRRASVLAITVVVVLSGMLWACGSESAQPVSTTTTAATVTTTTSPPSTTTAPTTVAVAATDFVNVNDLTAVRGFFVGNLLGDLDATLAVANKTDGGVYPTGSIIQLVPTEAMVKREPGFSPATNDWEFFELEVSESGTEIRVRGGDEVVNQFGGSCATCHAQAGARWDFVCEQDHGCDPLPLTAEVFEALQAGDPRPRVS